MNLKLLACLACSAALLLGACSSNNSSVTSNAGDGNGDGNAEPTPSETPLERAVRLRDAAEDAVDQARMAVGSVDTAEARRLIRVAREALTRADNAAQAAVEAAGGGSAAEFGRASREKVQTDTFVAAQRKILDGLEGRLSWFGRNLVREAIARSSVVNPGDGANTADIQRIPRTRDVNGDGNQQANPDAIKSTTFTDKMYASDKEVFSNSGDEFKVDGYVTIRTSADSLDASIHTGIKLTNDGLVIRTGGTDAARGQYTGDFTDMRKDITTWESDSNNDGSVTPADGIAGQNSWDLAITFNEPRTVMVDAVRNEDISDPVSSWRGNNAFYWRSLVRPADSQKSGGANYQEDAFNQPEGQENLGTYEVWLSNSIGVNRRTEPAVSGTRVICPDGSPGTRCPDDDQHRYLNYAAYGLFVYTADTDTFCACTAFNGQSGRINTLHFGYSAFANAAGQMTTDIGEPIRNGTFTGYTLAYEVKGAHDDDLIEHKLLRGDVSLTVNIPKGSGAGTLYGTMNNFQRWVEEGNYWTDYIEDFVVRLSASGTPAAITPGGTFSGTTTANWNHRNADGTLRTDRIAYFDGRQSNTVEGVITYSAVGEYKGRFYGPRANKNDLEIAGSWTIGEDEVDYSDRRDLYGSFGAKQNIVSTGSN